MTALTDRELLELAAKADGHGVEFDQFGVWYDNKYTVLMWNPLHHDGDALRLAVKLRLEVSPIDGGGVDVTRYTALEPFGEVLASECSADPYADTRRAIVRAAAAIAQHGNVNGGERSGASDGSEPNEKDPSVEARKP
jgi:hypothetical protein